MRRRVWCETLTFDEVVAPPLVAALRARAVAVLLAVRPWQLDRVGAVVGRLKDAGLEVGVWPMLADADGRWASVTSAAKFVAFADEVVQRAPACDELVLDLEPPLAHLARWKDAAARWKELRFRWPQPPLRSEYRAARDAVAAAVTRWRGARRVTTAVMPMLVGEGGGEWMQQLLGTPASALPVDRHSVMAYTSLFEGWSRGLVGRRRAEALLVVCARLARVRFGARAALSLGCVGAGAFGDEPAYRGPHELARDVALARRAGIDEITVFDLGGMVRRGPIEPWLDAFAP